MISLPPEIYVPLVTALAGVIIYREKVTIPSLLAATATARAETIAAMQDRIRFSETAIPVMTRTADLLVRVEETMIRCEKVSAVANGKH